MTLTKRWDDCTAEAVTQGLTRLDSCIHNGWQFAKAETGVPGFATNGIRSIPSLSASSGTVFSMSDGSIWCLFHSTTAQIYKSADGFSDPYVSIFTGVTDEVHVSLPQVIDCGGGRVVVADYGGDSAGSKLWATSDGGQNWTALFTTAADSIRHFHGGLYDAQYDRLYLFTGDSETAGKLQSSIVWTDDVDDLIANPAAWKTRWGLDSGTRATLDPAWAIGERSQTYRTTGAICYGSHIYFGSDSNAAIGVPVTRFHRETHAIERVWVNTHSVAAEDGNAVGETWCWGVANDGTLLMASVAHPAGPIYYGDGYNHVYALSDSGLEMDEIAKVVLPGGIIMVIPSSIQTIAGYTIISMHTVDSTPLVGRVSTRRSVVPHAMSPVTLAPAKGKTKRFGNLLLEDKWQLLLESGGTGNLLGEAVPRLLAVDGTILAFEDGTKILLEV